MTETLEIAGFCSDVTPPLGTPLCGGAVLPAKKIVHPLSARGVVLITDDSPIVLCSVDWVGIGNSGYEEWCNALAKAADTTRDHVSVHTVHPHDAPICDFSIEEILREEGLAGAMFDVEFAIGAIERTAKELKKALYTTQHVTHLGMGIAKVKRVASNRRIPGANGKLKCMRHSRCGWGPNDACSCEVAQAAPEGTVDPYLRSISFWNSDKPLVSLTYYATHPQSFYGSGAVGPDFVGMARSLRDATLPDITHIHFNGAGGNVAAGKYNDGTPRNRLNLAERLAKGMEDAWEKTIKVPITKSDVGWRSCSVALPVSHRIVENSEVILGTLRNQRAELIDRCRAARDLAWITRCGAGKQLQISLLTLGPACLLHMPGELFIEYQLAAQQRFGEKFLCLAAYGDYGPGYIGTEMAYSQGGYETGYPSRVAPSVEGVLMHVIDELGGGTGH